ncbi:hypothetical protein EPUL_005885, partial [Erysiphe pulchra]
PTPAKAAAILQFKDLIANRFGNATVERQESWTTFIVGPLPKLVTTIDGPQDPLDGLILQEPGLASIRDDVPIRQMAWKNKSKYSNDDIGHVRIHIPSHKAHKFPFRLQLFGLAVVPTCEKCFGFHSTRTCAREYMCKLCGTKRHEGPCSKPRQCLNCKGPHDSEIFFCPARPQRRNGAFVRLSSDQLRHIRKAGHSDYLKATQTFECSLVEGEATDPLKLAHENSIDILLIQEPWTLRDLSAKRSISHPDFTTFSPLSEWHTRPRALSYVRKKQGLNPYQTAIDISSDCVQIAISGGRCRRLGVWNMYNAPINSIGAGECLKLLLETSESPD